MAAFYLATAIGAAALDIVVVIKTLSISYPI
jgi:hypothetical protein